MSTALLQNNNLHFTSDGSTKLFQLVPKAAGVVKFEGAAASDMIQIENLKAPTKSDGAANKEYVDAQISSNLNGIAWKQPVRAASSADVSLSTGCANGSVLDGVTLVTGDRVLLKDQSSPSENGIYVVAASGAPSRSEDCDEMSHFRAASVFVEEGTVAADKAYNQTAESVTPGTTGNVWVAFSSNIFTGGDGLSFNNNIFSLNVDDSTVEIVSDIARVKAAGITDNELATAACTSDKLASASVTDAKLASNSVTTLKITDGNVTGVKLAGDSISTSKIVDANVTTAKLADDACTEDKIADAAVTSSKISAAAVGETQIADASITTNKIGTLTSLTVSGNANATAFVASSDRTLKMNISPLEANQCLGTVCQWSAKKYEFISEPGLDRYGVIAQELQATNPELVVQKEDGKLAVNYMDMSAYFIGAIQDLQARLLNQEAK